MLLNFCWTTAYLTYIQLAFARQMQYLQTQKHAACFSAVQRLTVNFSECQFSLTAAKKVRLCMMCGEKQKAKFSRENKNKLCSMTCGRVLQYKTQQGSLNTRWFISHHDFRMGCDPPLLLQQGGSKNTRWFISHYDFRMGCDPPSSAAGWFK